MLDVVPFVVYALAGAVALALLLIVAAMAYHAALSTRSRRRTVRRLDQIRRLRP
jgi:hypothetical protein